MSAVSFRLPTGTKIAIRGLFGVYEQGVITAQDATYDWYIIRMDDGHESTIPMYTLHQDIAQGSVIIPFCPANAIYKFDKVTHWHFDGQHYEISTDQAPIPIVTTVRAPADLGHLMNAGILKFPVVDTTDPSKTPCTHEWVNTGFRKTWCSKCNADGIMEVNVIRLNY